MACADTVQIYKLERMYSSEIIWWVMKIMVGDEVNLNQILSCVYQTVMVLFTGQVVKNPV